MIASGSEMDEQSPIEKREPNPVIGRHGSPALVEVNLPETADLLRFHDRARGFDARRSSRDLRGKFQLALPLLAGDAGPHPILDQRLGHICAFAKFQKA